MDDASDDANTTRPLRGLELEVTCGVEDGDCIFEVEVRAGNGRYAGASRSWQADDRFARLADDIAGFPAASPDRREVVLRDEAGAAPSGTSLVFRCDAARGHTVVDVDIRENTCRSAGELATFSIRVEPAAIDRFVAALRRARPLRGTVVTLPAAD